MSERWVLGCKVIVSTFTLATVAAAVALAAGVSPIIDDGESADFWHAACRGNLDGNAREGEVFRAREGWVVYRPAGTFLGAGPLCRISEERVFADLRGLEWWVGDAKQGGHQERERARTLWQQIDPEGRQPDLLLRELLASGPADPLHLARGRYADERWRLSRSYRPWQVVVELAYFVGLTVFALWPWWRSAGWLWSGAHLAWLPWLVLLPYWLGYAPSSFSTGANPEEAVAYPVINLVPRLEWTSIDAPITRQIPRPLLSLPGNPPPAMWPFLGVRDGYGPLAALVWSFVLCSPLLAWQVARLALRRYGSERVTMADMYADEQAAKWWDALPRRRD